jgi:hypothetical protein
MMKWSTVALVFLAVALTAIPRKLLFDRFTVVEFERSLALVIGSTRDELLVYAPDESDRPRRRVRRDAQGLVQTGRTRVLFDDGRGS